MPAVPSLTLNTGAAMPQLGLGTFQATDPAQLRAALCAALDSGYRLIDTAYLYRNEEIIGEVLQEYFTSGRLKREDVFVTTKLPLFAMEPDAAAACIKEQLASLRLSYIDLYLIHMPFAVRPKGPCKSVVDMKTVGYDFADDIELIDVWRTLEAAVKQGSLKAIGVSNFSAQQLRDLHDKAEIKPANLQVEMHIYWPQRELLELCRSLGIVVTGYAPIGAPGWGTSGAKPLEDPLVAELAAKYGKTPAQILIRFVVQQGVIAVPKSTNAERIKQNIDVFDFELSAEDQHRLLDIKQRTRFYTFEWVKGHRHYSFKDKKSA